MRSFQSLRLTDRLVARMVSATVAAHGGFILLQVFWEQYRLKGWGHPGFLFVHVLQTLPLIAALTLFYVAFHLWRAKRSAWLVALVTYSALVLLAVVRFVLRDAALHPFGLALHIAVPMAIVVLLVQYRRVFRVRSDIQNFMVALRFSSVVLLVAFLYGVAGFYLLERRDFHREISLPEAAHYTVDQFDLTTQEPLVPYSRRAQAFVRSLSVVSSAALAYGFLSFFQPVRAHLGEQTANRRKMRLLLKRYPASSEDFFKLWPHDKLYFFSHSGESGLAYAVRRGVALVVGDPAGKKQEFGMLLNEFSEFCRINDWTPAFVHIEPKLLELYKAQGFQIQKIGQEAVLNLAQFKATTQRNKYFRQINNRFTKQNYYCEVLQPPHDALLLRRLAHISREWLARPGRTERGFMLGYHTDAYLQQCELLVLRDEQRTIQGFINLVPMTDPEEGNFDFFRTSAAAPGNSNDFMLLALISELVERNVARLNLGLCPLAGLDNKDEERTAIDSALRFLYANGDRFYSFGGLYRFKAKYQPEWQGRYIAFRGGLTGFTRAVNALSKILKVGNGHQ